MRLLQRLFPRLLPRSLREEVPSKEEYEAEKRREQEELRQRIHDQRARLHYLEIQHTVETQRKVKDGK